MRSLSDYSSDLSGGTKTPDLSTMHWNIMAIPAAVLAVMAILQIFSFGDFKDWLESIRVGWGVVAAVAIIVAEVLGALSLLRIPMSPMLRLVGLSLAVLVVGFWFVESLYLATSTTGQLPNSGYFGKYLSQAPGWWTVLEVSVMLFWLLYVVELVNGRSRK